jgi:hypothetical protein
MSNGIGDVKGVTGSSVAHNNHSGSGGQKPTVAGSDSPNGCKPAKEPQGTVPMPK